MRRSHTIHLVDRFRRKVVERTEALITGRKPHEPWPEGPYRGSPPEQGA